MSSDHATPASFTVIAHWDDEAEVFYSTSDIPGLNVEAATFDEFVTLVHELAPEMISDNLPGLTGPVAIAVHARRDVKLTAA
jgi:hypothetical protein